MNRKISRNEKQVLKRRKVGPWLRQKHTQIYIAQEVDSNIFLNCYKTCE